jgi:hypothetical protein
LLARGTTQDQVRRGPAPPATLSLRSPCVCGRRTPLYALGRVVSCLLFAGAAPATTSLPSPLRTMPLAPLSLLEISCRRRDMRNGRAGQGTAHCSSTISCRERNAGTRGDEISTRGLLDVGGLESQSASRQQMARARRATRQAHYRTTRRACSVVHGCEKGRARRVAVRRRTGGRRRR